MASFTLIELVAVATLVSMLVGIAVLGMDGFSERGRLRSTIGQLASFDRLARTEAVCDGEPRRLHFRTNPARCSLNRPVQNGNQWSWSEGPTFKVSGDVRIIRVLPRKTGYEEVDELPAIRIRTDGTSCDYAVVVGRSEQRSAALVVNGRTGASRFEFELGEQATENDDFWTEGGQ